MRTNWESSQTQLIGVPHVHNFTSTPDLPRGAACVTCKTPPTPGLMEVCDGHGAAGHTVADFVSTTLPTVLAERLLVMNQGLLPLT